MLLARVEGNLTATRKHPSFEGWRLVICQPIGRDGTPEGTHRVGGLPDEARQLPLHPTGFASAAGIVYFRGWTPGRGYDLYAVRLCEADFNGDNFVDFFDDLDFITAFEAGTPDADFNGDGFLDFFDFDAFVRAFERGC